MYHTAEDFQKTIIKLAQTEGGDNEGATVSGVQNDDTPELLQPNEGPGEGPRGEHEAMSTGAEKEHQDNREGKGGYLEKAFDGFQEAARHDGADLSNWLDNFGPKAIVSRATAEAGQKMKLSSVSIGALADELSKIAISRYGRGAKLKGMEKILRRLAETSKGKASKKALFTTSAKASVH